MKSMKVKSLLLALGLSLVVGKSFAISFKVDGINYIANADTAIVKGYSEIPENGELKLASTVTYGGKDYRVTTVQSSAFLSCTDIKKLIVPASIKYIQSGAFESCVNMSNLVLEQGNDQLDAASDAFKNCAIEETVIGRYLKKSIFESSKSLQKVILYDNIKRIIPYAFGSCSKLEEINLDNVEEIGYGAFSSCSSIKKVILGNVRVIRNNVFSSCSNLQEINLGGVEEIGESAFSNCTNLKNVSLGSLKSLGRRAFAGSGLQDIELPSGLTVFGGAAFENSALTKVVIKSDISTIPAQAFCNCYNLVSIDIPNTVTEISNSAFQNCALAVFDMKNVIKIGSSAFEGCQNLETVNWGNVSCIETLAFYKCGFLNLNLPKSLQIIKENAFANCLKLESVDMSKTAVASIACFSDCISLRKIKFSANLSTIGYRAFMGCSSLLNIELPTTLMEISSEAFKWCSSLEEVTFPKTIQSLGYGSFAGASKLKEVDLSHTEIHVIPALCFENCYSLTNVTLNEKVDTIFYKAFIECHDLKVLNAADNVKMVYSCAFDNTKMFDEITEGPAMVGSVLYAYKGAIVDKEYVVPSNVTCIADKAFANQAFQSVRFNQGLKYIGHGALDNCVHLVSLNIPNSIDTIQSSSGCNSLVSIRIQEGHTSLYLGKIESADVKKLYLGRYVNRIDWMPNLTYLIVGRNVNDLNSSFVSSSKLDVLELEDAINSINIDKLPISNVKSLYLGRNVKLLADGHNFGSLEQFSIGEDVDTIPQSFVAGNKKLTEVELPPTVRVIEHDAFRDVINITKFTLHEGLKKIGFEGLALRNTEPLDSFIIPSTVKEIDSFGCVGIKCKKVVFSEGIRDLQGMAFYGLDTDSLSLPSSLKLGHQCFEYSKIKYLDASKYQGNFKSSFAYNENLEKVFMPKKGMTVLSENEFWGCKALNSIVLPGTIDSISHSVFGGTQIKEVHIPKSVRVIANRMFCTTNGGLIVYKPTIYIDGTVEDKPIRLNTTFDVDMHKVDVGRNFSYCFYADVSGEYEAEMPWNTSKVNIDSLVIRDVKAFDVLTKAESRFVPTTAICLSHYLTSCDMWKPTNGKIFVLPGSQLPKDDITYMYTVNKLEYVLDADGNVLFDGVNNMPYEITPVFCQDDKEVELKEAGVYDLSMKIAGTSFDGVYPTGLKVTVKSATGINRVVLDSDSRYCPIYNMNGQRVDKSYKGVVIQNGKKRIAK